MGFEDKKITEADLANKGVMGLPDTPNLSTMEMQEKFDEIALDVIVPKFNELVDELDVSGLDDKVDSEDITNIRLNANDNIEVSTDGGETYKATSSSGHKIMDSSGTIYPQRAKMQFSETVTILDDEETDKTILQVAKGEKGDKGNAATITIGNVTSGNTPAVVNVGSVNDAILNFTLARGTQGDAATIQVGTVQTGNSASVTNRGTSGEAIFDFVLPKGDKGDTGQGINILGEYATLSDLQTAHPTGNPGNAYMVGTGNPKDLYIWNVDDSEWANQGQLQGVKGDTGDAATITIGSVSSGETPSVTNSGTSENAIFNFVLPKGDTGSQGNAGTISVGTVESGDTPSVTNVGTPTQAIFDFVIPRGERGLQGNPTVVNGKSGANIALDPRDIVMTGYVKTEESSAITSEDTLALAIGKLESRSGGGSTVRVTFDLSQAGDNINFIQNGITIAQKTVPTSSPYVLEVSTTELGSLVITDSTTSQSTTVSITTYSLYEVAFSTSGDYIGWLESAGLTDTFGSLEAVLQSEVTLRTLFTKHASVDYLVEWLSEDADTADTILNTDLVAKWVNLRDYALDSLWAVASIKSVMDTADKYGYGEWVLKDGVWGAKGNVPIMTSNSAPYGEAIQISNSGDNYAWKAFNEDNSIFWESGGMSGDNRAWLGYKFVNPICVKMVTMSSGSTDAQYFPKRYKVQGSNDGSSWEDISSELTNANNNTNVKHTNTFSNDKYFTYIRVIDVETFSTHQFLQMNYLQFYGRELKVSVPTMTSNNAPWGEAIASGVSEGDNWKIFRNTYDSSNYWQSNLIANPWIGFDFGSEVCVKTYFQRSSYSPNARPMNKAIVQGSNDKQTWENCSEEITVNNNVAYALTIENINPQNKTFRYWRIYQADGYTNGTVLTQAQFYGLDYSEHAERHYLYDRGVELETITSGKATIDTTDYNLLRAEDTYHATTSDKLACGSANANVNGLPNNNYLDISNVNGNNATGWTNVGNIADTSFWVE